MTKQEFLRSIRQVACLTKKGKAAWDVAVNVHEKDPRWKLVSDEYEDQLNDFIKAFGVTFTAVERKKNKSTEEEGIRSIMSNDSLKIF